MTQHLEQRTEESFDGWLTPEWVLELVREMGPIGLDPCTEIGNPTKAEHWFVTRGREEDWSVYEGSVWVNPPYGGALPDWSKKIVAEADRRSDIFVLTPARTETSWFGHLWDNADAIAFFRKRVRFHHPTQFGKDSPKFPNTMFYFGSDATKFKHVFDVAARVVIL